MAHCKKGRAELASPFSLLTIVLRILGWSFRASPLVIAGACAPLESKADAELTP